jgi:hypothetical protein
MELREIDDSVCSSALLFHAIRATEDGEVCLHELPVSDLKLIFRLPVKRQPSVAVSPTMYAISSDQVSGRVVRPAYGHRHSSIGFLRW